jgi:hypothetical protein
MSFSKATDEQILQAIEVHGPTESNPLNFVGTIGNTFYISIYAGEDNPAPGAPETLDRLTDYKTLGIELYYFQPMPPKEELKMDPIEFKTEDKVYRFEFDVSCFPHISINPANDPQFKTQSWSQRFRRHITGVGYRADVDLHTLCEILRYCDRMARLKMFW